ncbi:MAG TPA: PQQ-binding-like beta-propeller repeat protein, partial [Planctomycetaceae bacterium]|nr:PQQ-binding-like beta-propeller repeat protein [Planctomycetaceae bacterium]
MHRPRICLWALTVVSFLPTCLLAQPWTADPMDWPVWRGPEQNGISREKNLPDSINPQGDSLLWKNDQLGSRSTPIAMYGKLYLLQNHKPDSLEECEKVVCVDQKSGEVLWENIFNVFLSDVPNTRVGWSSVVGDPDSGNVFALGVCDLFRCIDGETGKTLWERSLSEEFGMLSTYGGRTNFPIVFEDTVIISGIVIGWGEMAKPAHRFIAFNKKNGQPTWFDQTRLLPYDTTYSTPVLTALNGQMSIVFGSGDGGVHAFQARTGKKLWTYNVSKRGINTTPIVTDNGLVICGHSEENLTSTTMGALFALDGTKTGDITKSGEVWKNEGWMVGKTAPLILGERVYSVDDYGAFRVSDLQTGQEIYSTKIGTQGRSSPVYGDGKIYLAEANGRCFIFKPTDEGLEELESFRLRREGVLASPIISQGKVYLTTSENMYCFGKKDLEPSSDSRPAHPSEVIDKNAGPGSLQLVPVESLLRPDQTQRLVTRLYTPNGVYLKTVPSPEVEFTLDGPGKIEDGRYFPDPEATPHHAVTITAKHGDLTNTARIRVVPPLPWKIDFSQGNVPVSTIGIRYRNVHVDHDFLQKLQAEDPKAAQLYLFLQGDFVNNGSPESVYDNSTPRRLLDGLYIFMEIKDEVTSIEDAKNFLNAGLDKLVAEKFLSGYSWDTVEEKGVTFKASRGDRQDDGNIVMMKITTIPLGTRSQGWLGHSSLSDYTIQVDMLGAEKLNKLPDMGVIAQRYRLELLGASQELKLYSWVAHEKKFAKQAFEWKPDVWYTMKLRASHEERDGE